MFLSGRPALAQIETDKAAHAGISYGMAFTLTQLFKKHGMSQTFSSVFASMATFGVGFLKEASDTEYNEGDIWANAAGAGGSAALNIAIDF